MRKLQSFITPNTFLTIPSAKKLREHIVNNLTILTIVNYDQTVFESASVNNVVYVFKKSKPIKETYYKAIDLIKSNNSLNSNFILIQQRKSAANDKFEINIFIDESIDAILSKIKSGCTELGSVPSIEITLGLQPYHNTLHSESQIENRFLHSNKKKNKNYFVELGGRDVKKYSVNLHNDVFLDYSAELYTKPSFSFFEGERLIIREILSDTLIVGYTAEEILFNKSCYIIKSENKLCSNKYLLSILNSKVMAFYIRNKGDKSKQLLFPRITMRTIKNLPIKNSGNQKPFITLVDKILSAKSKNANADTTALEKQIDELVYKLYELTEEEIKIVEGKS